VVSTPHPAKSAKVPKQMLQDYESLNSVSMIDTSTSSKPAQRMKVSASVMESFGGAKPQTLV